jgi:hypothetical protein
MSAHNLDDETALGISLAILNGDIASFNSCVFLSRWIDDSTLEDRK